MMNRRTLLSATALGLAAPRIARAQAKRLVVACWGGGTAGLLKALYGDSFSKETGTELVFSEMPNPTATLMTSKGSGQIDLGICAYIDVPGLARAGAVEALPMDRFRRIGAIPERYRLSGADGTLNGIGAYMNWYGIAYNNTQVKAGDVASWTSLAEGRFRDKLALNRAPWLAAYDLTILSKALGGDERDTTKATELLKQISANAVTAYTSIAQMNQLLTRGEVAAGPFYSARVYKLRQEGNDDLSFAVPREGALALPYALVAAKGTRNPDLTTAFLAHTMRPENYGSVAAREAILSVDPTIPVPAATERDVGMSGEELKSRIYAADWNTIVTHWQDRTKVCEQIFARR
jgi:putative spermidine/putrescine transport system substrate-binding protein